MTKCKSLNAFLIYNMLIKVVKSITLTYKLTYNINIQKIRNDYMNSCEISAAVTAIANILFKKLNDDEVALLGAILVQLGDTLETMSVQKEICQNKNL